MQSVLTLLAFFDIQIYLGMLPPVDSIALVLWLATGISILIVNLKFVEEPEPEPETTDAVEEDVEAPK